LEIKRLLDKKGVSRVLVLITHHHTDHIYALTTLKPSEVYIPRGEELLVTSKSFRVLLDYGLDLTTIDKTAGSTIAPDIELNDFLSVRDGGEVCGFKAMDSKEHSPGQLGYSLSNELLYVGDALFGDKVLSRFKIPYLNDYTDYVDKLYKLMELHSSVE
jgi:glyoxylase-like metal-dependent hydrolase (beta-lactamase superfamily II)